MNLFAIFCVSTVHCIRMDGEPAAAAPPANYFLKMKLKDLIDNAIFPAASGREFDIDLLERLLIIDTDFVELKKNSTNQLFE